MHISDGILEPQWVLFWYFITAVFISAGLRAINKRIKTDPAYLARISLIGAVVFVISVWHIPVPVTGSSSHPVGTPLAAIIIGPLATVVISGIALFLQAFIAHGGITTIGANTFTMGIVGAFSGYLVFRLLKNHTSIWFSAGMAGLVGSIMTYIATALQLALSLNPGNVVYYWKLYSLGFIPTQFPLAFAEFAFTGYVIQYLLKAKTSLLETQQESPSGNFIKKAIIMMLLILSVITAGAYMGYLRGGDNMGIDTVVETLAAPDAAAEGIGVELMERLGEPLGFGFAGILGGLVTGYFWGGFTGKGQRRDN
jgi:cobalt/nickel transport system permease protein